MDGKKEREDGWGGRRYLYLRMVLPRDDSQNSEREEMMLKLDEAIGKRSLSK